MRTTQAILNVRRKDALNITSQTADGPESLMSFVILEIQTA